MKNLIDNLKKDVEIPEIVNQKAEEAFRKISTECEAENNITNREKNLKDIRTRKKYHHKRITVIAAAAVVICAVTAMAAALRWSYSLSDGMRASEEQMKYLESSGMNKFVEKSCTDNGVTVTAVQSITDNYYTHLAFRVEGFELEEGKEPGFENLKITVDGDDGINLSASFWGDIVPDNEGNPVKIDGQPVGAYENYVLEDGSMEYQITLFKGNNEKGYFFDKPIHVELENLGTLAKAQYYPCLEGTWTFDWTLAGADTTEIYEPDFILGDTGATVEKIEVSPISIMVEYDFPRREIEEEYINENGVPGTVTMLAEPPAAMGVKLKDGTVIKYLYIGPGQVGYSEENGDTYALLMAADRVIDVDEIESILFLKSFDETLNEHAEPEFYEVPILNEK